MESYRRYFRTPQWRACGGRQDECSIRCPRGVLGGRGSGPVRPRAVPRRDAKIAADLAQAGGRGTITDAEGHRPVSKSILRSRHVRLRSNWSLEQAKLGAATGICRLRRPESPAITGGGRRDRRWPRQGIPRAAGAGGFALLDVNEAGGALCRPRRSAGGGACGSLRTSPMRLGAGGVFEPKVRRKLWPGVDNCGCRMQGAAWQGARIGEGRRGDPCTR